MKTGVFLSVREKATRFPGKVLKPLGGKSVTAFLIDRLKTSSLADVVVLTTSTDPRDQILCDIAAKQSITSFCGSREDKLLRYRDAARTINLDFAVIVDGDDPFVSVEHIDRIIKFAAGHDADFIVCGGLPLGATGFGLSRSAMEKICVDRPESDTEVWGNLFLNNPEYTCVTLDETDARYRYPDIRMTLDYPEDYEFFCQVIDGLMAENRDTSFECIMNYISKNPAILSINRGVQEIYEKHLETSTPKQPDP